MMVSKNMMWGLLVLAAGACVAARYLPQARRQRSASDDWSDRVDEASEGSFPASDPPSFSAPATAVSGPTA
jgi:hypothetical protein